MSEVLTAEIQTMPKSEGRSGLDLEEEHLQGIQVARVWIPPILFQALK